MNKSITCQQFFSQPAAFKNQACYLIIGDDGYLVDKVYLAIKDLIRQIMPVYEQIMLYGDELKPSEISEYLDSYSLFSDNRVLIIRNADRLGEEDKSRKQPEKQKRMLELVANYLQNPEASQVLILIADSIDNRLTGWKKIKEMCQIIECEPIKYAGEMKAWLESTLKSNKVTMDNGAKDLFLNKVELDYCSAENEIQKLFIYCGTNNRITEKDVLTTMPTTRAGALGDFYKALGLRDVKNVLLRINDMLKNDWVPLQVISNIIKFYLTIWKIHALMAKHITPGEITSKHLTDIYPSQRLNYMTYANKYKSREISRIFDYILDADTGIKLSKAEPEVLLNLLAVEICNEQ